MCNVQSSLAQRGKPEKTRKSGTLTWPEVSLHPNTSIRALVVVVEVACCNGTEKTLRLYRDRHTH